VALRRGLERQGVHWAEVTGHDDFEAIFKALDSSDMGRLDICEVAGRAAAEESKAQFNGLNTMEKWSRWCELTTPQPARHRAPPWRTQNEVTSQRSLEQRRDRERTRMRRMIEQGLHRTPAGREQLVSSHLPKNLDEEAVQRSRRETLELVDKRSRRIRLLLGHAARQRHDLQHCIQALQGVDEERRRGKLEDFVREQGGKRDEFFMSLKNMLTVDQVNDFREEDLEAKEQDIRSLSRRVGISIPDTETIQMHFEAFNLDGNGISREELPDLLSSLTDSRVELSQANLNDLWRSMDTNGDGRISFSEYLVWHVANCGAPRLSMGRRPTKNPASPSRSSAEEGGRSLLVADGK